MNHQTNLYCFGNFEANINLSRIYLAACLTAQDQAISADFVTVQGVRGWIISAQNHKCIVSDKSTDGRIFFMKKRWIECFLGSLEYFLPICLLLFSKFLSLLLLFPILPPYFCFFQIFSLLFSNFPFQNLAEKGKKLYIFFLFLGVRWLHPYIKFY